MIKRSLLAALALAALCSSSLAQVNVVPQVGVATGYVAKQTFSAAFFGLISAGTTPTDVICLAGSASRTVRLQNLKISGSGTAISLPATLLRRVTADSGGTAALTTANPANTISKRDTTFGTATAVPIAYTANPTINDTAPTYIDSAQLGVAATSTGIINPPLVFDYAKDTENLLATPTLRGVAQQICLNFNSTTSTLLLNGSLTWTEE